MSISKDLHTTPPGTGPQREVIRIKEPIEQVIEDWQTGNRREENFRQLFERYHRPVFRFFSRRGFHHDECQDLLQETFLKVYRGLESFRRDVCFDYWLIQIAANTANKTLRSRLAKKRGREHAWIEGTEPGQPTRPDAEAESRIPEPLRDAMDNERKEFLHQAITTLPVQMRRCVRLRLDQDLSYRDIAAILGITEATVKVQLFRARKRLRSELEIHDGL